MSSKRRVENEERNTREEETVIISKKIQKEKKSNGPEVTPKKRKEIERSEEEGESRKVITRSMSKMCKSAPLIIYSRGKRNGNETKKEEKENREKIHQKEKEKSHEGEKKTKETGKREEAKAMEEVRKSGKTKEKEESEEIEENSPKSGKKDKKSSLNDQQRESKRESSQVRNRESLGSIANTEAFSTRAEASNTNQEPFSFSESQNDEKESLHSKATSTAMIEEGGPHRQESQTKWKATHFKFAAKDFIGEELGPIDAYYTLAKPPLGKGTFGEVYRAFNKKTGHTRAVKVIKKSSLSVSDYHKFLREKDVLRQMDNPHIIKTYEFFTDELNFYVVTEYCSGGDLFDKITKLMSFSENHAAEIMSQILSGVVYCHSKNIVHRDLKPENILFSSQSPEAVLKIIDFGFADYFFDNTKLTASLGTCYYVAPEVINGSYDCKCDIWSLGVILYILLVGFPPFNGANDDAIFSKIRLGVYSLDHKEWKNISETAKDLVRKMLCYDPAQRITAKEALSHPWISNALGSKTDFVESKLAFENMKNLQSFASASKLQEAIWAFMVNQIGDTEGSESLMELFKALDLDGDGTLTREELLDFYKKQFGDEKKAEEEVQSILNRVDSDGSGKIDYSEFIAASMDREKILTTSRLKEAFNYFDIDGNGRITLEELKEVFNKGSFSDLDDDVWKELIAEADQNKDGEIDFGEFQGMMTSLIHKMK